MSEFGGLVAFLMVLHCIGDWMLQWQWMAENKTKDWRVRFLHCVIYTAIFAPFVPPPWLAWIFATHFVIDSYKPLYWFRKLTKDHRAADLDTFKKSFGTPDGFFVLVTYDQIFHMITLLPVAWVFRY